MAKNDTLDLVLKRIDDKETWETFAKVLDIELDLSGSLILKKDEIVKTVNKEIRYNYGHTVVNLFRDEYSPDYIDILCAVADNMEIYCDIPGEKDWRNALKHTKVYDSRSRLDNEMLDKIENLVIARYLDLLKQAIIKEKGYEAWAEIEREIKYEAEKLYKEGRLSGKEYEEFKKSSAGGLGLGAFILAGNLSGFLIYKLAVITMFKISAVLGLGLTVSGAGVVLTKCLSILLGPVGIGLALGAVTYGLGDTNWTRLTPSVFLVAVIRKAQIFGKDGQLYLE